jgi:hypothetical protein
MLKLPENHKKRLVKCYCGYQSLFIIKDHWYVDDNGEHFCVNCQKNNNIGYFKKSGSVKIGAAFGVAIKKIKN